jgi:hypothetical protein
MDKDEFKLLTKDLIRYSTRLERDVLAPAKPTDCDHCPRKVINQLIICEPHKLGTERAHFKHKCLACRQTVYDGSYVKDPKQLRPFSNYILKKPPPMFKGSDGRKISKNGKVMGRPRKDDAAKILSPKRAIGRPRKTPTPE